MIIIVEKKPTRKISEGTWAVPKSGHEVAQSTVYCHKLDALKKELYGVFGDDILFDLLGNCKERIMEIATTEFIINSAKTMFPQGQKLSKEDALSKAIQIMGVTHKLFGTRVLDKNAILKIALNYNGWIK